MHLHLVSFNIPYPADYGGVIDVFHKIRALHSLGVKVHLHAYSYGRDEASALNRICSSVNYYNRPTGIIKNLSVLPYIVKTRSNKTLLENLVSNNHPVLLEGLHCTHPLYTGKINDQPTIVRAHNIEHEYYKGLADSETNPIKRSFFRMESFKLKRYEGVLASAGAIAAISVNDLNHFSAINSRTELITPFHPFDRVQVKPGRGEYILVHGDLSVPENIMSVGWILKNIVSKTHHQFIIAGKNPSDTIRREAAMHANVRLVPNPNGDTMENLMENAQICLIHSFYPQGFKLKLLHALHSGRFCICSPSVAEGTGLEHLCQLANSTDDYLSAIEELFAQDFNQNRIDERVGTLKKFSNANQAQKLIGLMRY